MPYVIRTEALKTPMYFAGTVDSTFSPSVALNEIIMNAWVFDDRDEAEALIENLPGDSWSVSEVSFGASGNLKKPAKPRPTFENDLDIVAEYEYGGQWLLDTMGGRAADYARIRALKKRGVYEDLAQANARTGSAHRAWIMAFGTKREQREFGSGEDAA
jgi:hypothetical protein